MQEQPVAAPAASRPPVDFLWLELTNRCNLQCVHCYADSGPQAEKGTLTASQYIQVMAEAYALGCRRVQFIGGEPTLNRDLPELIRTASQMGFEFIEVYTNLTILPEDLLQCYVENRVHVATSVYGPAGQRHDAITLVDGSFEKTIRNIQRVLHAGLPLRAGIVEMESNAAYSDATVAYLREMGVQNVSVARMRRIGRGAPACEESPDMSELCGNCAGSTLCVSPTGQVSPCIMSKKWGVGSISEASLSDLATGSALRETRERIYNAVIGQQGGAGCHPELSNRHAGCAPSYGVVTRPAGADCHPSFADRAACHPTLDPVVARPAVAHCHPSFADRAACHPTLDPVVARPAVAHCHPSFSDRAACAPNYDPVAARPASTGCHPSFIDRAACHPNFNPVVVQTAGADCAPTFSDRAACRPTFDPIAARPASAGCHPSFIDRAACRPTFDPVAARPAGAACHPTLSDRAACRPTFDPIAASQAAKEHTAKSSDE